mgnify:CR=1 FL=1
MTQTTSPRPVSVDELRRAWRAVQDGQFRTRAHRGAPSRSTSPTPVAGGWAPTEHVLPVVGCVGQAGASTLALAIATAASPARVLECCSATASGLSTAATAELGITDNGWTLGRRERVWIGRAAQVLLGADEVPAPDDPVVEVELSVLDVGWEITHVLASNSWVRDQVLAAPSVIAVTTSTIPGLRRVETTLSLLPGSHAQVAVIGAPRRRWPRHLVAAMGPLTAALDAKGHLLAIAPDRHLALHGLDSAPLPPPLLKAAETLLRQTAAGGHPWKGSPQ